jgi:hypothetical protein
MEAEMTRFVFIVEECAVIRIVDMITMGVGYVQTTFATRALANIVLVHS